MVGIGFGVGALILVAGCNLGRKPVTYPVDTSSLVTQQLAVGDLDDDGAADLVVGGENAYTVLHNDGTGGFTVTDTSSTVPGMSFVMLGDLDSDGALDMLAHDLGNTVSGGGTPMTYRLLGDGHGGFGAPTPVGRLEPRALGDLNGDGHPDLVSLGSLSSAVVRLGDGAGGFGSPTDYPIPSNQTFGFSRALLADFNEDGHPDVVASGVEVTCTDDGQCSFDPKTLVMAGDGTGALTAGALRQAAAGDLAVGDFDEDGWLDVVESSGSTTLTLLAGTGTADLAPAVPVPVPVPVCEVEPGDIDADGHLDVVVATPDNHGWVLFGDGTGQFPASHDLTTAGAASCDHVLGANLDGDPKPDVVYLRDEPAPAQLVVEINALAGRPGS